jgi:hypothetical protein
VRIAEYGGDAVRQHDAVELERRDHRGFDVQVGIDEARHGEAPAPVDDLDPLVARMRADDPVGDDGYIRDRHRPGNDVEQLHIADHQVGRDFSGAGGDHAAQILV